MSKYGLKNRTRISNAIDTNLYTQLKELSDKSQVPISRLLDNAIKLLLNFHETNK